MNLNLLLGFTGAPFDRPEALGDLDAGDAFDLQFMARTTLGRTWKDLSDSDRERWVDTFTRYTIWKLASQFDKYSGQTFVVDGEKPASRETIIVATRICKPSKPWLAVMNRVWLSLPPKQTLAVQSASTVMCSICFPVGSKTVTPLPVR